MEAPEKIYLNDSMTTDTIGELWPEWFDAKVYDNSIEYIRADVFIKKVYEWLKENGGSYWVDDYDLPTDELVKDFINYIKGEINCD